MYFFIIMNNNIVEKDINVHVVLRESTQINFKLRTIFLLFISRDFASLLRRLICSSMYKKTIWKKTCLCCMQKRYYEKAKFLYFFMDSLIHVTNLNLRKASKSNESTKTFTSEWIIKLCGLYVGRLVFFVFVFHFTQHREIKDSWTFILSIRLWMSEWVCVCVYVCMVTNFMPYDLL
jgi:hypothetical protein